MTGEAIVTVLVDVWPSLEDPSQVHLAGLLPARVVNGLHQASKVVVDGMEAFQAPLLEDKMLTREQYIDKSVWLVVYKKKIQDLYERRKQHNLLLARSCQLRNQGGLHHRKGVPRPQDVGLLASGSELPIKKARAGERSGTPCP